MSVSLFHDQAECCGCGACADACPRSAIAMLDDERGFLYPQVDASLCIDCGLCKRVCAFRSDAGLRAPRWAWAVTANSDVLLARSSSGGIAAVLSERVVQEGGVVYGVAMERDAGGLYPAHIRADGPQTLERIQGSKYAQSATPGLYRQIKADLDAGATVLFTGTPCQSAAMRRYLGKEYENLFTLDLICHGVPGKKMLQDFLRFTERELHGEIASVNFRGKSKGQGVMCAFRVKKRDGAVRTVVRNGKTVPYFASFLKALISRESCYRCPYACLQRGSDFTVGDFWGFHEEYPDAEREYGLTNRNGVSCVLVTSQKGELLLERCKDALRMMPVEAEKAARHNDQLRRPSERKPLRGELLGAYMREGYAAFDKRYKRVFRLNRIAETAIACIPKGVRRELMKLRGRLTAK